jgi:hypothetical protein
VSGAAAPGTSRETFDYADIGVSNLAASRAFYHGRSAFRLWHALMPRVPYAELSKP